jgi:uncharacterized membrane-anchored protein
MRRRRPGSAPGYGKAAGGRPARYGILAAVRTRQLRPGGSATAVRGAASKVPQITAFFWIVKILTTAQGEALADFLYFRFGPVIAGTAGITALVAALAAQFRARRYVAWIYWFAVDMVAVFGTMAADGLHIELGVPYLWSTVFYAACLAIIFGIWYATEKTLSIHSIRTWRREAFYWATVMATFALGTALGDLTATTMGLGYLASGVLFTVVIAVPAAAYWRLRLNSVLAFWAGYIVTRPLGASYADWLAVPPVVGGLDMGRGLVSLILTVVIVGFVGYLASTRRDVEERPAGPAGPAGPAPSAARHRHRLA